MGNQVLPVDLRTVRRSAEPLTLRALHGQGSFDSTSRERLLEFATDRRIDLISSPVASVPSPLPSAQMRRDECLRSSLSARAALTGQRENLSSFATTNP